MTIGSTLHKLNVFLFEKNKTITAIVGTIIILISVYVVFKAEANEKADEMLDREDIISLSGLSVSDEGFDLDIPGIEDMSQKSEERSGSSSLGEGSSENIPIDSSKERIITGISVLVTWEDEDDIRRVRLYENQPDTFKVSIIGPNNTELGSNSASNEEGQQGQVSSVVNLDEEQVAEFYDKEEFEVVIILQEAGDYEPRFGLSFITLQDNGNSFNYEIEIMYLSPDTPSEG